MTSQEQYHITADSGLLELLGKKLYSGTHGVILIRELIQNSIDAKSTRIDITAHYEEDGFLLVEVKDNGHGMSKRILTEIFLHPTGSYKEGNTTGGFGIAKLSIFACFYWLVVTRKKHGKTNIMEKDMESGACIYRRENASYHPIGTTVTCRLESSLSSLEKNLVTAISKEVKCRIYWNGELITKTKPTKVITCSKYNDIRYTLSYSAKVNPTNLDSYDLDGSLVYRINGLPQFSSNLWDLESGSIFVDMDNIGFRPKDSSYPFDLSRESVNWQLDQRIKNQLSDFLNDKLSRPDDGDQTPHHKQIADLAYIYPHHMTLKEVKNRIDQDDKRIARLWREIIQKVVSPDESFIVGITMLADNVASRKGGGLTIYYINPKFFRRYKSKFTLIMALYSVAIHEVTHRYESTHNENFTSQEITIAMDIPENLEQELNYLKRKAAYITFLSY